MVVGIDIFHDKGKDPSVAGIVCSMNKECTRFYSSTSRQMNRQELVDGIYVKFTGECQWKILVITDLRQAKPEMLPKKDKFLSTISFGAT